jgi:hypothetical protein
LKNYLLLVLSILHLLFASCESSFNEDDLNGKWIILEMNYLGEKVYPNSIKDTPQMSFDVTRYENAEKLKINTVTNTIVIPGFNSGYEKLNYQIVENNKIKIIKRSSNITELENSSLPIFCHTYTIEKGKILGELILRSDSTNIRLLNEDEAIKQRVDYLLNP